LKSFVSGQFASGFSKCVSAIAEVETIESVGLADAMSIVLLLCKGLQKEQGLSLS
jgi:hypothetical protein